MCLVGLQHALHFLVCLMVSQGVFDATLMNFLVVGHTHEDIDQLFAQLLTKVIKRVRFQTPEELCCHVQSNLQSYFKTKGECLWVSFLDHVHDFGHWLKPCGIHLHHAFVSRDNVDAPHSFSFKCRQSCSASEILAYHKGPSPRQDFQEHPNDVICITKRWMHSTETLLPICVLPHERAVLLHTKGPSVSKCKEPMPAKRKLELCQLADQLEQLSSSWGPRFSYFRGAAALRELATSPGSHPVHLRFLWTSPGASAPRVAALPTENAYFNTMPQLSWQLLARFHRPAA